MVRNLEMSDEAVVTEAPAEVKPKKTWSRKKGAKAGKAPTEDAALIIQNAELKRRIAELEEENAKQNVRSAEVTSEARPFREAREGDMVTYRSPTAGRYANYFKGHDCFKKTPYNEHDGESAVIAEQQAVYRAKVVKVYNDKFNRVDVQIADPKKPGVLLFEVPGVRYGSSLGQWSFTE